ncbi:MAG: hypothetical protein VKL39_18840, partial [Leptolyngbyaceae bacterium]|nr:hypothetical protein [Leptolyngbyaceae bacterium]
MSFTRPSQAPEIDLPQLDAVVDEPIDSLEELYVLRDRLTQSRVAALQGVMKHALATFDKRFVTFQNRQHILQTVH